MSLRRCCVTCQGVAYDIRTECQTEKKPVYNFKTGEYEYKFVKKNRPMFTIKTDRCKMMRVAIPINIKFCPSCGREIKKEKKEND